MVGRGESSDDDTNLLFVHNFVFAFLAFFFSFFLSVCFFLSILLYTYTYMYSSIHLNYTSRIFHGFQRFLFNHRCLAISLGETTFLQS